MKTQILIRGVSVLAVMVGLMGACGKPNESNGIRATENTPGKNTAQVSKEDLGTSGSMHLISDGKTGGNSHFFFLPPTVLRSPGKKGVLDRSHRPEVKICAFDLTSNKCGAEVASFSMDAGAGAERLTLNSKSYSVDWKTKKIIISADVYRIRVYSKGQVLGFADVKFINKNSKDLNKLLKEIVKNKNEKFIFLVRGQTLPIKFRIEEGAVTMPSPPPSFGAGGRHTCLIDDAGDAWCAGWNVVGQIGTGSTSEEEKTPRKVLSSVKFVKVTTGDSHSCAIDTNQKAWCWGSHSLGQLGSDFDDFISTVPLPVAGDISFKTISAGNYDTCGIDVNGQAYCWGYGAYGMLGNGTLPAIQPTPVAVIGDIQFKDITVGTYHTCGLNTVGKAYCWGFNVEGLLGDGILDNLQSTPGAVLTTETFQSITANEMGTCALNLAGKAYCWGNNGQGQLGNGTVDRSLVPTPVLGELTFKSIDGGSYHSCGLNTAGKAYCWGLNYNHELGQVTDGPFSLLPLVVDTSLSFASLVVGSNHTCAVTDDKSFYCWGINANGSFGDGGVALGDVPAPAMILP